MAEAHRSWVVEAVDGLPPLAAAGVEVVADVGAHQQRKALAAQRPHSAPWRAGGLLAGHDTIRGGGGRPARRRLPRPGAGRRRARRGGTRPTAAPSRRPARRGLAAPVRQPGARPPAPRSAPTVASWPSGCCWWSRPGARPAGRPLLPWWWRRGWLRRRARRQGRPLPGRGSCRRRPEGRLSLPQRPGCGCRVSLSRAGVGGVVPEVAAPSTAWWSAAPARLERPRDRTDRRPPPSPRRDRGPGVRPRAVRRARPRRALALPGHPRRHPGLSAPNALPAAPSTRPSPAGCARARLRPSSPRHPR